MRGFKDRQDEINYKLLKYRYKILLKNHSDINYLTYYMDHVLHYHTTENGVLELLCNTHLVLREAYELKEMYIHFNSVREDSFDYATQENKLEELIEMMKNSEIPEMVECSKTLKNWKTYILNSFVWINGRRISNGPIEGKHNYVKKMIHNANGFSNFQRARNRFIYSQNKYEKFSLIKHKEGGRKKP